MILKNKTESLSSYALIVQNSSAEYFIEGFTLWNLNVVEELKIDRWTLNRDIFGILDGVPNHKMPGAIVIESSFEKVVE